jgi:hypothetical protein
MKSIPIGTKIKIDGTAPQWPFERIVDTGTVLDRSPNGYLVQLDRHRENLTFRRRDIHLVNRGV